MISANLGVIWAMSVNKIQINSIRVFEAVVRLGSVKSAAAELHITSSAVSHGDVPVFVETLN